MKKTIISIIAVIGKNRELGKEGKLLWHIPQDMRRFKKLTVGHVVIMGRKTFESIGRPLLNRVNIVITRNINNFKFEFLNLKSNLKSKFLNNKNHKRINDELFVCNSLESAIDLSTRILNSKFLILNSKEIFIIGGGQIYAQAMKYADKLYLTIVDKERYDADTFFPDYSEFSKIISQEEHEENGQKFYFIEIER